MRLAPLVARRGLFDRARPAAPPWSSCCTSSQSAEQGETASSAIAVAAWLGRDRGGGPGRAAASCSHWRARRDPELSDSLAVEPLQ